MITKMQKQSAEQIGYKLQLNQHAPNGYKDAYSIDCFPTRKNLEFRSFCMPDHDSDLPAAIDRIIVRLGEVSNA